MLKLILINGQSGSGKTTVARKLMQSLENSAHISTDTITMVNPFDYNNVAELGIKNACLLANSYAEDDYQYVILCGLLNTQQRLSNFISAVPNYEIVYFWLNVDENTRNKRRLKRARGEQDNPECFDYIDQLIPNVESSLHLPNGSFHFIDANQSVDKIVLDIKNFISSIP